MTTEEATIF